MSLAELGRAVGRGELSAADLVQSALSRIAERDGGLNAVVALRDTEARAEAEALDTYVRGGGMAGLLAGVPFLVKDTQDVAGMRTTHGSLLFADAPAAASDDVVVGRLRAAGAIVIGKTNTPEFAIEGFTDNLLFGATRNPWNPALSSGGSSGGSAAALAAGMVPLATATDGGGSSRIPAALCGLVGYKPTNGVVGRSRAPEWIDFQTDGFMATRTEDLRGQLQIAAGPAPGDRTAFPGVLPPGRLPARMIVAERTDELGALPGAVARAFADAVEKLAALLGLRPEWRSPGSFFGSGSPDRDWFTIASAEHAAALDRALGDGSAPALHRSTAQFLADGRGVGLSAYVHARRRTFDYAREMDLLLRDDGVLVTPTLAVAGFFPDGGMSGSAEPGLLGPEVYSTAVQNVTGLPAISVPAGILDNGLPFGLQITAPRYADRALLDTAELWERHYPWPSPAGFSPFQP